MLLNWSKENKICAAELKDRKRNKLKSALKNSSGMLTKNKIQDEEFSVKEDNKIECFCLRTMHENRCRN